MNYQGLVGWLVLPAVLCLGCQAGPMEPKRVDTQEQAGSVQVAVVGVIPWQQIVGELGPNFQLSGAQALQKVVPNTQFMTEKFLDAFAVSARVSTPRTSTTIVEERKTSTNADHDPTDPNSGPPLDSTFDRTRTSRTDPGDVATVPDPGDPSGGRKATDLPGLDLGKQSSGVEPMHQHWNALALFQEVNRPPNA